MIDVKENEDGSFTISWDPNNPAESVLNTWTESDFIDAIMKRCEEVLECDSLESGTEVGLTD